MNIVIPDRINMPEVSKQKIRALGGVIHDDLPQTPSTLIERIKDAELITANYVDVTKEIIDASPKLRYIVVPAVGYEWIDVAYAASKNIVTVNCPTFNSQAVAEYALTLLLAASRKLAAANNSLIAGNWDHALFSGIELHGKKLGLVGHGNIGQRIERLVGGFEMKVKFVDSKSTGEEIDDLARTSELICICAPLTEKSRHMFDARRLQLLQKDVVLVNVGRG